MTYSSIDADQEQRAASYQIMEDIYIEGISDAMNSLLPQMAEVTYLTGYAEGMRQFRKRVRTEILLPVINTEPKEFPLLCGQCQYLNNRTCTIKSIKRDQSNYACDRVVIDSPF